MPSARPATANSFGTSRIASAEVSVVGNRRKDFPEQFSDPNSVGRGNGANRVSRRSVHEKGYGAFLNVEAQCHGRVLGSAGYAEGLGLPVIYTCEEGIWNEKKTHFDTNHMVTIIWNAANLDAAAANLTATIRATFRSEAKQSDD
jgi:hypothetical protein